MDSFEAPEMTNILETGIKTTQLPRIQKGRIELKINGISY